MITDDLRHRYLNDAVFHALVERILIVTEADRVLYSFADIRAAVDVAEHISLAREKKQVPEHVFEFYMNGSFCTRCGASIGSGVPCR